MRRLLPPFAAILRSSRRFNRPHPNLGSEVLLTRGLLAEDAFHPQLQTHKLKGKLAGSWVCSGGYDLLLIFQFVKHKVDDAILLEGIGTHDEVY